MTWPDLVQVITSRLPEFPSNSECIRDASLPGLNDEQCHLHSHILLLSYLKVVPFHWWMKQGKVSLFWLSHKALSSWLAFNLWPKSSLERLGIYLFSLFLFICPSERFYCFNQPTGFCGVTFLQWMFCRYNACLLHSITEMLLSSRIILFCRTPQTFWFPRRLILIIFLCKLITCW